MSFEPLPETSPAVRHRAARVSDTMREWREERARKDGQLATVVPYTGYGSTSWIRVLGRVLLTPDITERASTPNPEGIRGWRSFVSVPVDHAKVNVTIGEQRHVVTTDRSGLIDAVVPISLSPGWHTIGLQAENPGPAPTIDRPPNEAEIYVVDSEARLGLVSDADDTVMVTASPRPLLAAWNVAPSLTRFLARNLYPAGPLLFTDWGPTETSWFRSGTDHKHKSLERLTEEFPNMKWLLIGDDGQHDEEIYGDFVTSHPDRVIAVCIRQLSPGQAMLAGSAGKTHAAPSNSAVPWLYGPDGSIFVEKLKELGVLVDNEKQPTVE